MNDREKMETSFSLSEPSSSKKQKLADDNDFQDELDSIKLEIDKMKKIIDNQKDMIYEQAMTIRELQNEHDTLAKNVGINKNMENKLERLKNVEEELRSKIVQLEAQTKDDKKKSETDMAKPKSTMDNHAINFEKERKAAHNSIKELEKRLSSAKDVKPGFATSNDDERKALQDKINELQSACNDYAKNIKGMEQLNQVENDKLKVALEGRDKEIKDLEAAVESEKKNAADLQFELEEMQQCYKDDLNKNKELKDEYDKKMTEMKAEFQIKLDTDRKKYEANINALNSTNDELLKKITKYQKAIAQYQDQIKELNDKITVANAVKTELSLKNEEYKQKELEAHAIIIDTNS